MDTETFIANAVSLYGKYGWQTQLAKDLGISLASVHRYRQGKLPVPQVVALAMEGLKAMKEAGK